MYACTFFLRIAICSPIKNTLRRIKKVSFGNESFFERKYKAQENDNPKQKQNKTNSFNFKLIDRQHCKLITILSLNCLPPSSIKIERCVISS